MKVLLDTNVLLSAVWRDRLPEKVVQYVATDRNCQWIVTAEIFSEYVEVLKRPKFGLSAAILQQWVELIETRSVTVPSPNVEADATRVRDPQDVKFLAAAIATSADFLITGDNDLLQAKAVVPTQIVTVAEFAAARGIVS